MPKKAPEKIGSVLRVPLSQLHPHPQNPFAVRDDPAMQELKESVSQNGVLVPAIARPRAEGGYELIAGHRRKYACEQAGIFASVTGDQLIAAFCAGTGNGRDKNTVSADAFL